MANAGSDRTINIGQTVQLDGRGSTDVADLPPWNVPISRVRIWDTTRGLVCREMRIKTSRYVFGMGGFSSNETVWMDTLSCRAYLRGVPLFHTESLAQWNTQALALLPWNTRRSVWPVILNDVPVVFQHTVPPLTLLRGPAEGGFSADHCSCSTSCSTMWDGVPRSACLAWNTGTPALFLFTGPLERSVDCSKRQAKFIFDFALG